MGIIKFKRLSKDAVLPKRAHAHDAGLDLVALENVIVGPGDTVKIPLGFAVELPAGYVMDIRPRSGITLRTELRVAYGTVDAGYTGEVGVTVDNIEQYIGTGARKFVRNIEGKPEMMDNYYDNGTYIIRKGDRIAQAVILKLPDVFIEEVEELSETERGANGHGSTGVRV